MRRAAPVIVNPAIVALAIVALLLGGAVARAADPVIGAVYPAAGAGAAARAAIDTALDIVNGTHVPVPVLMGAGGGLDRLNGAKLAVTYADGGDDPAQAAAAAERLVTTGGATMLVGGLTDAAAAAISRVAEAHGLPFLALHSAQPNDADLSWFFRLGRTPARDARGILRQLGAVAAARDKPFESIALVFEDPAGQARATPVRTAAAAAGLKVVDVPVPAGPLPPAAVQAAADAKPAAVLALGLDPAGLAPLAAVAPLVLLGTPPAAPPADGVFRAASFTLDPLPARPGISMVDAAFQARTGHALDAEAAREITGLLLLADVVNRAGSTKPIDLRTALMATDTPGSDILMLWEGIRFDDTGQNVRATPALQQAKDGTFRTVAPDDLATAPATWPSPP